MINIDTQETDYSVYPLVSSKNQCPREGNRSTRRKPPTCSMSLTNFIA
jgi:hypothetical protein